MVPSGEEPAVTSAKGLPVYVSPVAAAGAVTFVWSMSALKIDAVVVAG